LKALTQRGVTVVGEPFKAGSGLTGWILQRQGHDMIVYTTADGKRLLAGSLLDESGKDVTPGYTEQYLFPGLFKKLEASRFVAEGPAAPKSVVYAFMDPNCVYCHLSWKALQPYIKAGLQVRWVPVAFLKPTSVQRAAAILEAKSPVAALQQNERSFVEQTEDGGLAPVEKPKDDTVQALSANRDLMQSFGSNGTPTLVWKDKNGVVHSKSGMPPLSALAEITGLPNQPQTDAELEQFR
ncbi:MAG: thiol:disulfide interchange protein DsbG, partial [Janthinobacterium lividum]